MKKKNKDLEIPISPAKPDDSSKPSSIKLVETIKNEPKCLKELGKKEDKGQLDGLNNMASFLFYFARWWFPAKNKRVRLVPPAWTAPVFFKRVCNIWSYRLRIGFILHSNFLFFSLFFFGRGDLKFSFFFFLFSFFYFVGQHTTICYRVGSSTESLEAVAERCHVGGQP